MAEQVNNNKANNIKPTLRRRNHAEENIVATADLNCKLDIAAIASKHDEANVLYDPMVFDGLIIRYCEPKATALVFESGKVVCTGAKTEREAKHTALRVASAFKMYGYSTQILDLKVEGIPQNIPKLRNVSVMGDQWIKGETRTQKGDGRFGLSLIWNCIKPLLVVLGFVKQKAN